MRLYDHPKSGNGYKVRLLLAQLGIPRERVAAAPVFVGGRYTIADIALNACTHVAEEGAVGLDSAPNVRAWIDRIEAQSAWIPMEG